MEFVKGMEWWRLKEQDKDLCDFCYANREEGAPVTRRFGEGAMITCDGTVFMEKEQGGK